MKTFARCLLLSLVIPFSEAHAQRILDRLEDRLNDMLAPPGNLPPNADAYRRSRQGYLGLAVQDDEDFRTVVVTGVQPGSPAVRAGFRVDDEIIAVNNRNVRRMNEVTSILDQLPPGAVVDFEIRRDGSRQRIQVTLGQRPFVGATPYPYSNPYQAPYRGDAYAPRYDNYAPQPGSSIGAAPGYVPPATTRPAADRASLGITVAPITDEARDLFGLVVRRGAMVTVVKPGGVGEKIGMQVGDVVVAYEGQRIDSPDDLINTVRSARVGDEIELSYYRGEQLTRVRARLAAAEPYTSEFRGRQSGEPPLVIRPNREAGDSSTTEPLGRDQDGLPRIPVPPVPASDHAEVMKLKEEVHELQKQVAELQKRLIQLENMIGEKK